MCFTGVLIPVIDANEQIESHEAFVQSFITHRPLVITLPPHTVDPPLPKFAFLHCIIAPPKIGVKKYILQRSLDKSGRLNVANPANVPCYRRQCVAKRF